MGECLLRVAAYLVERGNLCPIPRRWLGDRGLCAYVAHSTQVRRLVGLSQSRAVWLPALALRWEALGCAPRPTSLGLPHTHSRFRHPDSPQASLLPPRSRRDSLRFILGLLPVPC